MLHHEQPRGMTVTLPPAFPWEPSHHYTGTTLRGNLRQQRHHLFVSGRQFSDVALGSSFWTERMRNCQRICDGNNQELQPVLHFRQSPVTVTQQLDSYDLLNITLLGSMSGQKFSVFIRFSHTSQTSPHASSLTSKLTLKKKRKKV